MMLRFTIAVLLTAITVLPAADAQLRVNRMIAILGPDAGARADFELINNSEDTLYLSNRLFEVIDPHAAATRVELTDPRSAPLIATPRDLVLGPSDRRLVRVFTTDDPANHERVFRMTVTPQAEEFEPQGSGVQVLVGYELLIIRPPADPDVDYDVVRDGQNVTITNRGNTFVFFDRVEFCPTEGECQLLGARRVYAGGTHTIEMPGEGTVRLRYRTADDAEVIVR